jgi:hypothetical protein
VPRKILLVVAAILVPGGMLALGFALLFRHIARAARARRLSFSWRAAPRPQMQARLVTAR